MTVTGPSCDSSNKKHLHSIDVNMNKMPGVAMTFAIVTLFSDGPTTIRDGRNLRTCLLFYTLACSTLINCNFLYYWFDKCATCLTVTLLFALPLFSGFLES